MLDIIKKEDGVVALHLLIRPLKIRSGLEPVPRCEPISHDIATAP